MNLTDIDDRTGPYWAAYQAERSHNRITDNPGRVPAWFLARLARNRVAAARVGLEQTPCEYDLGERVKVHDALRTLEGFIGSLGVLEPEAVQVIAGLLGAQEVLTERERREVADEADPRRTQLQATQHDEHVALTRRHLVERGITTADQLIRLHAEADADREQTRAIQWAALDHITGARTGHG